MKKQINYVDLFAGIGGMHLGLQQAAKKKGTKINCLFYSEIDKYCIETYEKNFPNSFNLGDISQIKNKEFEKYKNQVDIITAGFPCQPFSFAGKKQAFKDERGTLFFDIMRLSNQINPKIILLENVRHLLSIDNGNVIKKIINTLKKNYHVFGPEILCSRDFGIPQNRRRVFILATNKNISYEFPIGSRKATSVSSILEPEINAKRYMISDKLWVGHVERKKRNKDRGVGFGYGLVTEQSQYTNTLSARYYKDGGEILVQTKNLLRPRKLTPRECARLQGFPDSFKIPVSDNQAYRQFGNSVTVPIIKKIFEKII
jgi:DNA (cytosine-5)-methyltransferase 1